MTKPTKSNPQTTPNINQDALETLLWAAADSARGTVDGSIFKDYVLTLLFYKYMSDLHEEEHNKLKAKYGDNEDRIKLRLQQSRFIMPEGTSFAEIYANQAADNIGELLNIALHKIEDANKEHLHGIFTVDFNSESILGQTAQRNKMIRHLLQDFNALNFANVEDDILGNAYMYMIERFGSEAGKKAGEFFTPKQICSLVAKLALPEIGNRISDPTAGSASLLLRTAEEIRAKGSSDYALYGQEKTGTTYNLARMNVFLHKEDAARLEWGDTLNNPLLVENGSLMLFDRIVANPPFSLDKWGEKTLENDKYNRFFRGMPPASKGDYAFISHMVASATPQSGRVVVVVPHGVLFRGAAEGRIRKAFIEENILDAIIGLPSALFQTATIPVAILIFDRSREKGGKNEKRKDIFFIDASREFIAGKKQNKLGDEHIEKIVDTYLKRENVEKYAHLATMEEICENEYNLNITRYVDTFEEEEEIDISAVNAEITKLEQDLKKVQGEMQKYLEELGLCQK